jgi:hypothetical protein
MAQTIAVQRGSTTVSGAGASKTTLFTLSSGTATRVIVGGVSAEFPGNNGYARMLLSINVNGSGSYLPVLFRQHNQYSNRYLNSWPNSDSSIGVSLSGRFNDTISQSFGVSIGSSAVGGFPGSIAGSLTGAVYQSSISGDYVPLNITPGQFWMANGDSLVVQAYNELTPASVTIIYHFVTVTES